jgi:CheY-like chemotaxis protein
MGDVPTFEEVLEEVEKIAGSEQFIRSRRLVSLLEFTVDTALNGKSGGLSEFEIAARVYGRGSDFDPAVDGIVRAEMHRLRDKLSTYYREPGGADAVRIEFPRGSYVPSFRYAGHDFMPESGAVATMIRARKADHAEFGSFVSWPVALKNALSIHLRSALPAAIFWGPAYNIFFNDAMASLIGPTSAELLGKPFRGVLEGAFPELAHLTDRVATGRIALSRSNSPLFIPGNAQARERYFDLFLSPLSEGDELSEGVLVLAKETTDAVLRERRSRVLLELFPHIGSATSAAHACHLAAGALQLCVKDVPFASIYLFDAARQVAYLQKSVGVAPGLSVSPLEIVFGTVNSTPVSNAAASFSPQVLEIAENLGPVPRGDWESAPRELVIMPLVIPSTSEPRGLLIAGANARCELDADYRDFFRNLAARIASCIAGGSAAEEHVNSHGASGHSGSVTGASLAGMRPPLAMSIGIIEEILRKPELDALVIDQLQSVRRIAYEALNVVDTTAELERVSKGSASPVFEPLDTGTLTAMLGGAFSTMTQVAGLQLKIECPSLPADVWVDRVLWEKIVLHLLSIAIRNTSQGEVGVSVRDVGNWLELQVWDTGPGMSAAQLQNVSSAGSPNLPHSRPVRAGVEIPLVARLARLHGGKLHIESQPGKGTRFTVSIPRGHAHLPPERVVREPRTWSSLSSIDSFLANALQHAGDARARHEVSAGMGNWAYLEGIPRRIHRVLVSVQTPELRRYCEQVLGSVYAIETVTAPGQVAGGLSFEGVDLLLIEASPEARGVLRTIRANPPTESVGVIVITAHSPQEDRLCGGADAFLSMPFTSRDLLVLVEFQIALANRRRQKTDRERKARELAESHSRLLEQVLDVLPIGIIVSDATTGARTLANREAMRFLDDKPWGVNLIQRQLERERGSSASGLMWLYDVPPGDKLDVVMQTHQIRGADGRLLSNVMTISPPGNRGS